MNPNIRPYHEPDEEAVVSLWQSCFGEPSAWNEPRENIRRKLGVQRELFLVAEIDRQIVGTAMGGYDGHRGWVYYLAVHEAFRKQGIATELVRRVERELAAMGCSKINLMVRTSNLEVQTFYEKLGYQLQKVVTLGRVLDEHRPSQARNERDRIT